MILECDPEDDGTADMIKAIEVLSRRGGGSFMEDLRNGVTPGGNLATQDYLDDLAAVRKVAKRWLFYG